MTESVKTKRISPVRSAKTGKIETVQTPLEASSEEAFGLRRVAFLLPQELADEFEERGGAAWLALVLTADEHLGSSRKTAKVSERAKSAPALLIKPETDIRVVRGVDDPTALPTYNRRRVSHD
ncbi:hypothetical protein AWB69_06766 [Caballeronia udeis]|uniref:Uncharacterized protein n=1 Tax=Caballeronia udeis TaxID=1232866 RepID=A0A158IWM8_9BURK|nr:hypothetical protein [Caballeronia udeis]SAL60875.1 hypothetical protein AWB69_06766 [Caballeronia udeis]